MSFYSDELDAGNVRSPNNAKVGISLSSAFARKSNKWFQENRNKIQGDFPLAFTFSGENYENTTGSGENSTSNADDRNGEYPCQLNYFVLPQLKALYWILHLPSQIEYDSTEKKFIKINASIPRRALIVIIHVLSLFYTWGTFEKLRSTVTNAQTVGFMYQIMYISFAFLAGTFYYVLFAREGQIRDLLNNVEQLTAEVLKQSGCQLKSRRKLCIIMWIVVIGGTCNAILFTAIIDICAGNWHRAINPTTLMEDSASNAFKAFHRTIGNKDLANSTTPVTLDWPFHNVVLIGLPYFLIAIYSTFTWVFSFQMILFWGFLFRKLMLIFFVGMSRHQNQGVLKFLRQFHKISLLIEDYNDTFGISIFTGIMSSIMYMSNTIWSLTGTSGSVFTKLISSTAFFIIGIDLLVCSDVNNMANRISFAIKLRYQNQNKWKEYHAEDMEEVSQGLNMVYYDLISNSIGVKGYGFFTISYSFVGTVVSMILTYSIIILQFQKSG